MLLYKTGAAGIKCLTFGHQHKQDLVINCSYFLFIMVINIFMFYVYHDYKYFSKQPFSICPLVNNGLCL